MRELDEDAIRRYLLGLLPEAEADALEDSYFADPDTFDRVRGIEDDLLDDHAAGRLSPADARALEARYLASAPLRRRLEAARALRMASEPAPAPRRARMPRWLGPLAVAAALAAGIAGVLMTMRARAPRPAPSVAPSLARVETPTPIATPSASPTTPSAALPSARRVVLALSPTLLRGESGGVAEARLAPRTDVLVLDLQVQPSEVEGGPRLGAVIETVEGARVWSGGAERVESGANLAAEVTVPAAHLPPGDYLVTLSAGGETLHRYFFRVPRG